MSFYELLELLSDSKEYEEVPVRHEEENLNEALSKLVPHRVDMRRLDSPHVKTNLLFQAYFSRAPLPIRDYVTDTKLVIDACIRFLQAMIELASEKSFLQTTLNLMYFCQMVTQGVWLNESSLQNIPYFSENVLEALRREGVEHLCQLIEMNKSRRLSDLLRKKSGELRLEEYQISEVEQFVAKIPDISFRASIRNFNAEQEENEAEETKEQHLEEGGEAKVVVNLRRENAKFPLRVDMRQLGKTKDASWWLVVADETKQTLLSLKKIFFKDKLRRDIQISLPTNFEESPKLTVMPVSYTHLTLPTIYSV
eukprot:TRINITY_DN7563_c0_g4_i4.p1 TRINITY_DN7563_c0_g4~~TRINITY_DN7563_c0_g4_i4.p1  ORF type:complete len:310 (-),score=110.87 TRINITY_DN7563_c0_g4_i4:35-964(-)